jgi:hypothetical protein
MELFATSPAFEVQDAEYLRLLGYPRGHEPGERVRELMAWARGWYAAHGRPWIYQRRVALELAPDALRLDGREFGPARLREHLQQHSASGAALVAVSAGRECEDHARELWDAGKPDEYFFLEIYGSAVVEDLVARTSGRLCDSVSGSGLAAVPHYSPGYAGWDVAGQSQLFDLIMQGLGRPLPGPLEVLTSGMLRPKKSLLAVFGLAPVERVAKAALRTPCEGCSFSPCAYRRAPYRHQAGSVPDRTMEQSETGPAAQPRYSVNTRALRKWAAERVTLAPQGDGTIQAIFRFDGTTCSHRPLAFDYRVRLSGAGESHVILDSSCTPAAGDEGHRFTCSYLAEEDDHLREIAGDRPLVGRPLDEVFAWSREAVSTGCHCSPASRAHKWGLAYEAIHYALHHGVPAQPVSRNPTTNHDQTV